MLTLAAILTVIVFGAMYWWVDAPKRHRKKP